MTMKGAVMRAVRVEALDGPAALVLAEVAEPVATSEQLLIDVHAAPVVFPDLLLSRGQYQLRPELPFDLGSVASGVVRSAPDGSGFAAGDRVTALTTTGGWADVAVADPLMTFPLPDATSFADGAVLPFNYSTMHFGLTRRGRLQPGETVLVHGAAGGIGTASVQLAKALGARVIGVVSSPEKQQVVRDAGADEVIAVEGFKDAAKQLTGGRGVDIVVDPVGGDRFTDSLRALAPEGRLLVIGFTAGEIPSVKVNRLLLNNLDVVGVGFGAFWTTQPQYLGAQWGALSELLANGALRPLMGEQFTLDTAVDALKAIDERRAKGNLVIAIK
jgi:NADPH2:quinone reductase